MILQLLGSCSFTEIANYFSSPDNRLDANTDIINYGDFNDYYDFDNFDNYDDLDDDYTPMFFGLFMADQETEAEKEV